MKLLMAGILLFVPFLVLICSASSDPVFYESFDDSFEGRWAVSGKDQYGGVWKHAQSNGHDDHGLLVSEPARKYAIVKEVDAPLDLKGKTVVLQYETRMQNGLECGGAYIKYLRPQEAGWAPKDFDNESPYSIMFGPDKCGMTDKVHFILKHMNPKTGEYIEHHLRHPPSVPSDKLTHVYTAILTPDNGLRILVDGEEKKQADFLSNDFDPPIVPSKTIPDPDDEKPEDWDDRSMIPDLEAVKPDDWDEEAPMEILDEEAKKPEGWLEDEPEEIDDPEATKPEDWDDEEDGEWEAPKIENPKCETAPGCGEWKRPMKRNPAYKGKWEAPLLSNPNYKGIWQPQEIPNPHYFELETPNFDAIAAVGIEIWTMQDGILFDNILIATDEKTAESYRESAWKPKFDAEEEKQKVEEKAAGASDDSSGIQKKFFEQFYRIADIPFLEAFRPKIMDLIEKAEAQPKLTIGILMASVVVMFSILFKILFGGKKSTVVKSSNQAVPADATSSVEKKTKAVEGDDKEKDDAAAPRKRPSKREN